MFVFSPVVLFTLQLVGLLPVSVNHLPLRGDIATFSWSRLLYSILLAIYCFFVFCSWLFEMTIDRRVDNHTTYRITSFCSFFSTFLGAIVCLGVAASGAKQKILLVEKLREVDFLLQRKSSSSSTRVVSVAILSAALALILGECVTIFDLNRPKIIVVFGGFQFFRVVILCGLIEVMELVLTIRERFELVNERVLEVVLRSRSKHLTWTAALPCVETFTMPQEMTMTIHGLSETHWSLCCVIYDINAVYGCHLVTSMVFIFAHLVFYPYYLFLVFNHFSQNLLTVMYSALWILLLVVELYVLVLPCSLTVKEAKKTVTIVTKLMGNRMAKPLYNELEAFADQLFHRDVEFTACGLFTLHTSIIVSVASAVTTYMAIIIQFQTSTDAGPETDSPTTTIRSSTSTL